MIETLSGLWWAWGAAALILAILEVLAPGFIFLGFAIGAAAVAVILWFPVLTLTLPQLVLAFAAFSLVAWLILRKVFARPEGQVKVIHKDVNDN